MYESYWQLNTKPFENTPDPRFIFYSDQHEEVLSRLLYSVREGKGAAMLTGVFGCGKTLIARTLLAELDSDIYKTVFITNPYLSYQELLLHILHSLSGQEGVVKKSDVLMNVVLEKLNDCLLNNMRDGKRTVVIIDEAHIIKDPGVWEEIRLLLNFQLADRFLMTLLLLGQPELKRIIDANKQFSQRIAIKSHLQGLNQVEANRYIKHRLGVAGRKKDIFSNAAQEEIFKKSGGIPRRINNICDLALLTGFGHEASAIDEAIIRDVSKDLEA